MILTTNEQVFNTIFRGVQAKDIFWRVVGGVEGNYSYKYCDEYGVIPVYEIPYSGWRLSLEEMSKFGYKYLDPNYKDEGAIINKIRVMAKRFEDRRQAVA